MAQPELPPQLREQITQFQNLQQQLQMLAQQKAQYDLSGRELSKAGEALRAAPDDTDVFKSVGAFLMRTKGKAEALKEVEDESETLGVRIKNLERQESRMKESLTELQSKIQNALSRMQAQGGQAQGGN